MRPSEKGGAAWPGLVVPDIQTSQIMRPVGAAEHAWFVILLERNDERRWYPDSHLTDFTAESGDPVPPEVEKGAKLAQSLLPLPFRGRVAEFIRIRRLQEMNRMSQLASWFRS